MLSIINTEKDNLIAAQVSGKMTKADVEKIHPMIHQVLQEGHNKVDWYIEIEEDTTYSLAGLIEDIKVDALHLKDYGKVAIVGNSKWQEWASKAANFLTNSDIKFYEQAQKEQALEWVKA